MWMVVQGHWNWKQKILHLSTHLPTPTDKKNTAILPPQLQDPWQLFDRKKIIHCKTSRRKVLQHKQTQPQRRHCRNTFHCLLQQCFRGKPFRLPARTKLSSFMRPSHWDPYYPLASCGNPKPGTDLAAALPMWFTTTISRNTKKFAKEKQIFAWLTRNHSRQNRPSRKCEQTR